MVCAEPEAAARLASTLLSNQDAGAFPTIGEAAEAVSGGVGAAGDGIERRDDGIVIVESYCVECGNNGKTTFLPTVIPHFKRIIVSAFSCPHCGYSNSETQIADFEDKGCRYVLTVTAADSLNRQVVKSDKASLRIPELDFDIPASPQSKAVVTTLEGLLTQHIENLEVRVRDEPRGCLWAQLGTQLHNVHVHGGCLVGCPSSTGSCRRARGGGGEEGLTVVCAVPAATSGAG
eukprot:SAG25_NODE_339_length_9497_cov_2.975109_6_plen_233_part_00